MDKLSFLESVFVFSGIEKGLLSKIAGLLKETRYASGTYMFKEQEQADSFFIIDSGEVTISKKLGHGREKVLAVMGHGSVFGEKAFFSNSPRTANAIAKTDCLLWKMERKGFLDFLIEEPEAGLKIVLHFFQVTMDRLEKTSRELATVYQTGKIISSGKNIYDIIKEIQEEILLAVPEAEKIETFLYNRFNDEFTPVAAPHETEVIPTDNPIPVLLKERYAGVILRKKHAADFQKEPFFKDARSFLISPIIKDQDISGFMILWNKMDPDAFRNDHMLLVSSVCGQIAELIENIKNQQEDYDRQRLEKARQIRGF